MRFSGMKPGFWPFVYRHPDEAIVRDADELIATWGEGAYDEAARLSWREDAGLIQSARAGHWSRVKREIGARFGRRDPEPEADFGVREVGGPSVAPRRGADTRRPAARAVGASERRHPVGVD